MRHSTQQSLQPAPPSFLDQPVRPRITIQLAAMAAASTTIAMLLLMAAAAAQSAPAPAAAPASTFAKQHSGAAAGVVEYNKTTTAGSERKIGGLDAYVVSPPGGKAPTSAVVLITDIFGWKTTGIRKWADKLAGEGFLVVVPDYFKGNPRTTNSTPASFPTWIAQFPRDKVLNETAAVFAAVRSAYPSVKKIGVQGFCWGGLYAVLLTHGKTPASSASVIYHGSLLKPEDIAAINAPVMFQQADPALDQQINGTFYKQIEGILGTKAKAGLPASITSYKGQGHGFSLRGDSGNATTAAAADKAFAEGAAFLKKHLAAA